MGFWDLVPFGSVERQIQRHSRRIRKKDATQEDRQASAQWLAQNGSPEAVLGLLGRFEMTYEHHMKDEAEKEEVFQLVLGLGEQAIEPLEAFLRRTEQFARPLALYERLAGRDRAIDMVASLLERERERSELKPDKKRRLLVKLAEYRDPRAERAALTFTRDFDEGVRYAAAEVLIAQQETPAVRDALLAMLANPDEESHRLRARIAEVAERRGWPLGGHEEALAARPPSGWRVQGGRLVRSG